MKNLITEQKDKTAYIVLFAILALGAFVRLYNLGNLPDGIHADEAYAAYNAYSLAEYGVDSFGYHNPVYFIAWGGGMNVLNSYLMIPMIKLFGLSLWSVRLPQALLSCLSLAMIYGAVKRIFDQKTALLAAFLMAICPWHIMMTRNNIESALLPTFFIMGLYFFVRSLENSKWLIASAAAYGLCLYSYATIWPFLPFIILLQTGYCIYRKRLSLRDKYLWIAAGVLAVMALPLLLFMLVNYGVIPEIKTAFISIPQMLEFRSSDISAANLPENTLKLLKLLDNQQDGLAMNSTNTFGLYYRFSNAFIVIGVCILGGKTVAALRRKEFSMKTILMIQLCFIVLQGLLLLNAHATRINCIHFILVICIAAGIVEMARRYWRAFAYIMVGVYLIAFVMFLQFYREDYGYTVRDYYRPGIDYCMEDVMAEEGEVYVDERISFPIVMYYTQMPVQEFMDTVTYRDYPSMYLKAEKYGRFTAADLYNASDDVTKLADYKNLNLESGVYVLDCNVSDELLSLGYHVNVYDDFCVAVKK